MYTYSQAVTKSRKKTLLEVFVSARRPLSRPRCKMQRALALWLVVGSLVGRAAAIQVDDTHQINVIPDFAVNQQNVDPEEFLWDKLTGRCCFESSTSEPEFAVETCEQCSVWSDPDNFCHKDEESCKKCGMGLFCPAPPPLIGANVVCTGHSQLEGGCKDPLSTGICAGVGLTGCQEACRFEPHCNMFVLSTLGNEGACELCRDMNSVDNVPATKATRVYQTTFAPPPPGPPGSKQVLEHFQVVGKDEAPPPPPCALHSNTCEFACSKTNIANGCMGLKLSPGEKHVPGGLCMRCDDVRSLEECEGSYLMSMNSTKESKTLVSCKYITNAQGGVCVPDQDSAVECESLVDDEDEGDDEGDFLLKDPSEACRFHEGVEFSTHHSIGYSDINVKDKEACCNACQRAEGCNHFVYEPSSSTCELLPHVEAADLVRTKNKATISGSLTSNIEWEEHTKCSVYEESTFANGRIGLARDHDGLLVISQQGCCDACAREPGCAKWAFAIDHLECTLFEAYAERFRTSSNMVAGLVREVAKSPPAARAPMPPAFPSMWEIRRPPPPPTYKATVSHTVTKFVSMALLIMVVGLAVGCGSLFLCGGKWNGLPQTQQKKKKRRQRDRHSRRLHDEEDSGAALTPVTIHAGGVSQTRGVDLQACKDQRELRLLIMSEFDHLLKGYRTLKPDQLIVSCWFKRFKSSRAKDWTQIDLDDSFKRIQGCAAIKIELPVSKQQRRENARLEQEREERLLDEALAQKDMSSKLQAETNGSRGAIPPENAADLIAAVIGGIESDDAESDDASDES